MPENSSTRPDAVPIDGPAEWRRYAVAVGCAALIVLVRHALAPLLPTGYPFLTLFIGVYAATWYGGFGPGLTALLLGVLGVRFLWATPAHGFVVLDRPTTIAYGINFFNNLLLIMLGHSQYASRRRAERSARSEAKRAAALEAEMARREAAESTLGSVLEATTDAYLGFDRDWRIVYVNAQASTILDAFGLPRGSLLGRNMWETWPDMLGTIVEQEFRRVVADRAPATFEYFYPPYSSWLEVHAYPTPGGMAMFFRDVTEQRRVHRQLQDAQRMDAVGQLAGGVAHEVNNQMTVVLGSASFLLRRPDLPAWARGEVDQVRQAALRSAAVTGQLLAFGRRQLLRPQPLDLNVVVRETETILGRALGPAVQLVLEVGAEPAVVMADRGQLDQALLNLTFNARDAMPRGGVLRIETSRIQLPPGNRLDNGGDVSPGPYATLRVADSGVGMDQVTLSRAFEPFFTTKGVGEGTGLGLSTVYGIVRQSGGHIVAESAPGTGAAFTIYLPLVALPAEPVSHPAPDARAVEPAARRSRGVALVVEDEVLVRGMIVRVVEEEGYEALAAGNGAEALELIERRGLDGSLQLVITDLAMPVMDGRELARRLAERTHQVPLLFISGFPDAEIVRRGLLAPGQDFLPKPFTPVALAERLRRLAAGAAPVSSGRPESR